MKYTDIGHDENKNNTLWILIDNEILFIASGYGRTHELVWGSNFCGNVKIENHWRGRCEESGRCSIACPAAGAEQEYPKEALKLRLSHVVGAKEFFYFSNGETMSEPTTIGDILPGIMKELEEKCVAGGFTPIEEMTPAQIRQELQATRLRLVGKLSEVKSLHASVDEVCKVNAELSNENARLTHFEGYRRLNMPDLPLTAQDLKNRLNGEQYALLFEHATCLACLQGNAFDQSIEQYCLEAYVNLWQNSHVGDRYNLPNLYPVMAAEYYSKRTMTKHE